MMGKGGASREMPSAFNYLSPLLSVHFGPGRSAEVAAIMAGIGVSRALVLATPQQAEIAAATAAVLGPRSAGQFTDARMHTPVAVTETATSLARDCGADCLVAIGGGSTIGLGKAISVRTGLPQIAIPTTYAGSEMTDILGETAGGEKTVRRAPEIQPGTVIYDVDLTLSLPPGLSVTSGMNAIAHAVEALYAHDGNPVISLLAEEGVRALATSLHAIVSRPSERAARLQAQYGAWLCAMCLRAVSMSLHHQLCHVLGGKFDLPHAATHAIVLPHALAYNAPAVPGALERLERALGSSDPVRSLFDLNRSVGAPRALRDLGMPEAGIAATLEAALAGSYANPRPLEREPLLAIITRAWAGEPPVKV